MRPGDSYLSIYLNDHLAGSTTGLELARRAARSNSEGELGEFLRRLVAEIEEDRDALIGIMDSLEIGRDRVKVAGGWLAEKVGRLKPNGHLVGYSPLSRLVELEGLVVGVNGKLAGWQALREIAPVEPRLDAHQLDTLIARGERQEEGLRQHHRQVAREALPVQPPAAPVGQPT